MTKDQCCVLKHLTAGETDGFEKIGELDDGEFLDGCAYRKRACLDA